MRRLLVMVLVACDSGATPTPAAPTAQPVEELAPAPTPPPPETPRGPKRGTMHATWSKIEQTDTCWYFSGPDGRDTKLVGDVTLERDGSSIRMMWGNATFTGKFENDELTLSRTTTHDFDGDWAVTEKIKGKYVEGAIHAKYRYTECEHGTPCPNHCTITAELDLTR